jgi:hypothetical protein
MISRHFGRKQGASTDYELKDTPHTDWDFSGAQRILRSHPKWQGKFGPIGDPSAEVQSRAGRRLESAAPSRIQISLETTHRESIWVKEGEEGTNSKSSCRLRNACSCRVYGCVGFQYCKKCGRTERKKCYHGVRRKGGLQRRRSERVLRINTQDTSAKGVFRDICSFDQSLQLILPSRLAASLQRATRTSIKLTVAAA